MRINVNYSGKIINLPSSVAKFMGDASYEELAVIIGLYANGDMLDSFDKYIVKFSEDIGIGVDRIYKALDFWSARGVISVEGRVDDSAMVSASSDKPIYSGTQIAKFVEKSENIHSLFDACQKILEKDFNSYDHNNIVFLKSTFHFSNEYIMLLLSHCKDYGKASWHYIKKSAQALYDEGIDTYTELSRYITSEIELRELFDIGQRELLKPEREHFGRWISLKLDKEIIRLAYDIAVEKTEKAPLSYCSKVIENWLSSGIKTIDEARASEEGRKKWAGTTSFDTSDFLEAALNRSYSNKKENK